jgi:hypothetical protein
LALAFGRFFVAFFFAFGRAAFRFAAGFARRVPGSSVIGAGVGGVSGAGG